MMNTAEKVYRQVSTDSEPDDAFGDNNDGSAAGADVADVADA
jgi:hypothetical protein